MIAGWSGLACYMQFDHLAALAARCACGFEEAEHVAYRRKALRA